MAAPLWSLEVSIEMHSSKLPPSPSSSSLSYLNITSLVTYLDWDDLDIPDVSSQLNN